MRLLTMRTAQGTRAGLVEGQRVRELPWSDVRAVLALGADWRRTAKREAGVARPLSELSLAPVVPQPEKIICLGRNYGEHVAELARDKPAYPILFAKFHRSLVGPHDPVRLPPGGCTDWEAELAMVIGREARHVRGATALDAIGGYTVMNDVSARDWQSRTPQWLQGKTFEQSTPLGPHLVTTDEAGDLSACEIRCEVNGEVMQRDVCGNLLFGLQEIVEYVSDIITLVPGDVIATGTPGGVGLARTPPVFLRHGDLLRTVVEGVGECVNRCVA